MPTARASTIFCSARSRGESAVALEQFVERHGKCARLDFAGPAHGHGGHGQERGDFRFGPLALFIEHRELLFETRDFELGLENILLKTLADRVAVARDLLEPAEQSTVLSR